ncbi:MAG: hypothetical protein ABIK93_02250 [candidate division WOR-3 bacterium]
MPTPKKIFLAWASTARRSATLAKFFGAQLFVLPLTRKKVIFRLGQYLILAIRTFPILLKTKPTLIFVQCPPIYILFPVYLYAKLRKVKYIIDAHTAAFIGKGFHFAIYLDWLKFFAKRAKMTIIPNEELAKYLANWQIPYFILEDGIPNLSDFGLPKKELKIENKVAVICGFGSDEPIDEIVEAAKLVPNVQFYVTGAYPKVYTKRSSPNLQFTGFLSESDYIELLKQVDLVAVLTKRESTILCGAYEALSLEKPMILSDTKTLSHHFPKGVVRVENTVMAIADGIKNAYTLLPQLQSEISQLKLEKIRSWTEQAQKLKRSLEFIADC